MEKLESDLIVVKDEQRKRSDWCRDEERMMML
jgi:hypothetical protein